MNANRSSMEGFHRFLEDLRSWGDRRAGRDRRTKQQPVAEERRCGLDRRKISDRRCRSQAYSPDAVILIREMLVDPRLTVRCPDCDGGLMLGPKKVQGAAGQVVHCTACRRTARLNFST